MSGAASFKQINQLPPASLPLTGTELFPMVQNGITCATALTAIIAAVLAPGGTIFASVMDSSPTATISFKTPGGKQMEIFNTPAAVNYWQLTGSAGVGSVVQSVAGVAANIPIIWTTKGLASHGFYTHAATSQQFSISGGPAAVNFLQVAGDSGTEPSMSTVGAGGAISLNLYAKGGGVVRLGNINGGNLTALQVSSPAAGVNYVSVSGAATTGLPSLSSRGSDANVGLAIATQGTGRIAFVTDTLVTSVEQFRIIHVANAVNYLQAAGAPTLGSVILSAQGTDASIGQEFRGKGAGGQLFVNNNASQFVIGTTLNSVNYLSVAGAATGVSPTLSAVGEVNAGIIIQTKGTGSLVLDPQAGDIRWNKAVIALGGGAGATNGTIGGAGPTVAAQNSWLRFLDSGGAAAWLQVWK